MKTKTIRQSVTFKASPHEIYEMLMDSRRHAKFTGAKASISRKVGGKFSAAGGSLSGKNLKLVKDKTIVQSWRAGDWPQGHYSTATFALAKAGQGTRLTFTQTGVPADHYDNISEGWRQYYWTKMKAMLQSGPTSAT